MTAHKDDASLESCRVVQDCLLTFLVTLQYGNGTLRLTTRQTYQLHGVLKQDLKTVFSSVIKNMGSTLAACGDVNRNVCSPPAPYKNRPEYLLATQYANDIADLLAPQSGAYYDVWLDGEKFFSHQMEVNPLSAVPVVHLVVVLYSTIILVNVVLSSDYVACIVSCCKCL